MSGTADRAAHSHPHSPAARTDPTGYEMLLPLLALSASGWTLQKAAPFVSPRARPVRLDADRCYYGTIDEEGNVVKTRSKNVATGLKPNPSLGALEVVEAQFNALSRGSHAGVEEAYQFLSPKMIDQYSIDVEKFRAVLNGAAFEGLIGVAEWKVLDTSEPSDDVAVVKLRVLPKPVPGCVRSSGVANQGGITWPTHYKWVLGRVPSDAAEHAGCWMLDNMLPDQPPIDVPKREGAEQLASSAAPARAAPATMMLGARRTSSPTMKAYSTLTTGDRKVIFGDNLGKGLGVNPQHTQIPMAAQSFVNEIIQTEGLAMNTPRYKYSRIFALGFESMCDLFLSVGISDSTAQLVRESLCVAFEFEPEKVAKDAKGLAELAKGKTEEELLALDDLKALSSTSPQYSYTLGAGLLSLMKEAGLEPDADVIKRWCEALNIKAVNSFTRDYGYFQMNVKKFAELREMFAQMEVSAAKKKAANLAKQAEAAEAEAKAAEAE